MDKKELTFGHDHYLFIFKRLRITKKSPNNLNGTFNGHKIRPKQAIVDSLLKIPSGMLFRMFGGWLDIMETYLVLALGLIKGLWVPVERSNTTSRKSTNLVFPSMVIFRFSFC